jgi:D-alanine-D-alanine ligase
MEGILEACRFDRRILIERGVENAREIEISVLGNEFPRASIPGEIRPADEFYSYNAKYYDDRSELIIPAPLPQETITKMQEIAIRTYKAIDCAGMARVDFLVDGKTNQIFMNEVNTIPGFTKISMYPKLWEAAG